MVEQYTIFFPVCVRYDESNNHIYVTDKRNREWDCWIASPSDKKLFEEESVRYFQGMFEYDGGYGRLTVLVNQPAEPFEYDEDD